MKRKILSLALALMMIISVAAAMPVSAEVADIVVAGSTATGLTSGYHVTSSAPTTYDDGAAWAAELTSKLLYGSGSYKFLTATFTVSAVTAGWYEVNMAFGRPCDTPVRLEYGGEVIRSTVPATSVNTHATNHVLGKIYLNEGDNTVAVGINTTAYQKGHAKLYGLKFVHSTEAPTAATKEDPIIVDATAATGFSSGYHTSYDKMKNYEADAAWAGTCYQKTLYGSSNASKTHTISFAFTVLSDGYYDINIAYARATNVTPASLTYNSETISSADLDATTDAVSAVNHNFGRLYLTQGSHTVTISLNTKYDVGNHLYLCGLKAVWSEDQTVPAEYTITAAADPVAGGTVTPATTTVEAGTEVTLTATPDAGYLFDGWYDGATKVSSSATYTIIASESKDYTAKFSVDPAIYVHETNDTVTKLSTASWSTAQTATTNNTTWAETVGIRQVGGLWNGFEYTVPVTSAGWYDIYLAYATAQSNARAQIIFDNNDSVDAQSTLPATGSNTATISEAKVGKVYLTAGDHTIQTWLFGGTNSNSYQMAHYGLKFAPTTEGATSVNINGGLPTEYTAYQVNARMEYTNSGLPSWVNYGSSRIDGNSHSATYTASVPTSGYYTVKIAIGATANTSSRINFAVDGVPVLEDVRPYSPISGSNGNLQDAAVSTLTRIYLDAGSTTFTVSGVQDMHACRVYNILLEKEDLPTANTIRITDDDDNDLSTVTGGSRVTAEVALDASDSSVEGAKIFLVQYAGTGAEKTMVASSYITTASTVAYSAGGYNFYNTALKTVESAGEVKAFLWKADGSCVPLLVTSSVPVN